MEEGTKESADDVKLKQLSNAMYLDDQEEAKTKFSELLGKHWHNLDWFKIWSSGGAICIVYKVGHQVVSLALLHCLGLSYWHN